jgi:hypothetical protein
MANTALVVKASQRYTLGPQLVGEVFKLSDGPQQYRVVPFAARICFESNKKGQDVPK